MQIIAHTNVIGCTLPLPFLPKVVIAITTTFVCVLNSTLEDIIERLKARWALRGFREIPGKHYGPLATHALVESESSLLITSTSDDDTQVTHETP